MVRGRAVDATAAFLRQPSSCRGITVSARRANVPRRRCAALSLNAAYALFGRTSEHLQYRNFSAGRALGAKVPADGSNIAVLGGGLTGLTTTYYLAKQLSPATKITLYESSDRLGGWIQTDRMRVNVKGVEGRISFERGPRTLSSLNNTTWRFDDLVLWDLALDLGLQVSSPPDQPRYIYYPDHLVSMPPDTNAAAFIREPVFLQSCLAGIGYVFRRLFRKKTVPIEDISIADWIYEICGSRSVAENLASAMIHGIYGGNIYKLSARSVLDRFYWAHYLPNQGPNIRHMSMREQAFMASMANDPEVRKMALKPRGSLLHFGDAGMEALPNALEAALRGQSNVDIKLSSPIEQLKYNSVEDQVTVTTTTSPTQKSSPVSRSYDKVISTIPSQNLTNLTSELPSFLDSPSVSIMTVNVWYPKEDLKPPGFGYLIPMSVPPEQNPERALGVFFDSDVAVRASDEPRGTKLFILLGGHYYSGENAAPIPTEEEAIEQAKSILERHLGIPRSTPCYAMARLAKDCIPQYNVGHQETMMQARKELLDGFHGRLAVAGGSYSRIGAMGALRNGHDIAKLVSSDSRDSWNATGLEHLDFPDQFCGVPIDGIPVRRFKASR